MPTISERGKKMPASPIRKLVPYAEAAKKKGVKSLSFKHWSTGYKDARNCFGSIKKS